MAQEALKDALACVKESPCPAWFKGKHWHFLRQTFDTLARHAQQSEPSLEFSGFELYMETAA